MNNSETAQKIQEYLVNYVKNKCKDKIVDKITGALGVTSYYNLLTGNFPAAKLAAFTVNMLKGMHFYGFYQMYGDRNLNPYNPRKEDEWEQYSEYLLYSWKQGKAGYIWQFEGVFR